MKYGFIGMGNMGQAFLKGMIRFGKIAPENTCAFAPNQEKLMEETGLHPGELKDRVCSPGGTTIKGIYSFPMTLILVTNPWNQCKKMRLYKRSKKTF